MSPTEFDLRSALRDGEGEPIDVDGIVASARVYRAQRRTRLLSAAAVVVVVASAGVGGALLLRGGDGGNGAGGSAARGNTAYGAASASQKDAGGARVIGPAPPAANSDAAQCPASFPQQLMPGGGSPGQFGSDGALFAKPVASVTVCAYGAADATPSAPARLSLSGTAAATLASSLEHAATTRSTIVACPVLKNPQENRLAIVARASDGTVLPTVTTTLRLPFCNVVATNGTAVRYDWRPPDPFATTLLALTPQHAPATGTGGAASGSPPK